MTRIRAFFAELKTQVQVNESSGYGALDRAAVRVAWAMKFDPATRRAPAGRCVVPLRVALDVTFEVQ